MTHASAQYVAYQLYELGFRRVGVRCQRGQWCAVFRDEVTGALVSVDDVSQLEAALDAAEAVAQAVAA